MAKNRKRLISSIMFLFLLTLMVKMPVKAATPEQQRAFIASCQNVGNIVVARKFRYGNGSAKGTLNAAISGGRRTNCALFASWCLQEFGLIDKGKVFYATGGGRIVKNFGSWGSKVHVVRINKSGAAAKLQVGDVCCWTDAHVNIYAGKTATGKNLWVDGGKISTKSNSNGSRYKSAGKLKVLGYCNSRKISYAIRMN